MCHMYNMGGDVNKSVTILSVKLIDYLYEDTYKANMKISTNLNEAKEEKNYENKKRQGNLNLVSYKLLTP